MFSRYFGSGTDEPVGGLKEKKKCFIRPSTNHHVLNAVAQEFHLTLAWKKATCRDLWSWNGIRYDKSLYHIANSARGQDQVNPMFWLDTWADKISPPSPARDSPCWYRARKLTKFVTFRQCRHIHKKKINDPLGFIVLQKQLAFTVSSRNRQVILDSHESEIFCYTMHALISFPWRWAEGHISHCSRVLRRCYSKQSSYSGKFGCRSFIKYMLERFVF